MYENDRRFVRQIRYRPLVFSTTFTTSFKFRARIRLEARLRRAGRRRVWKPGLITQMSRVHYRWLEQFESFIKY